MGEKRKRHNRLTSMDSEELVSVSSLYAALMPPDIGCDANADTGSVISLGVGAGVDTDG